MNLNSPGQGHKNLLEIAKKYPYYTIAGFLVIVLLVDYFCIMRFQLGALTALSSKITVKSRELQTAKKRMRKTQRYRDDLKKLKEKMEDINRKIKSREEIPRVLENISRIANRNSVHIERIMPDTSVTEPILENNEGQYFSIPVVVEAGSSYHDLGRFLSQLEAEGLFWDISEFTVIVNMSDSVNHIVKLTFNTVVFDKIQKQ